MIVGRRAGDVLVAATDYEEMAILYAGDELHTVVAKLLIEIVDELGAVFCREMTAVMILYLSVVEGDDIASDCHVVGAHLVANTGSFERSPTLIHLVEVITEDSCVCHL